MPFFRRKSPAPAQPPPEQPSPERPEPWEPDPAFEPLLAAVRDLGYGMTDEEVDQDLADEAGAFVDEVREARDALYDPDGTVLAENRAEFDHVRETARLAEASVAEGPALAFANAEIYPRDKGLGIFGPNLVHALGRQLDKEIARANQQQLEQVTSAVLRALSFGYVGVIGLEPAAEVEIDEHVTPAQIWTMTVQNFRGEGLKSVGLDGPIVGHMETFATDALVDGLRDADLLGRRAPAKLQALGRYYAHAGGFLRIAQVQWPVIGKAQLMAEALGDEHWPYDQYMVS